MTLLDFGVDIPVDLPPRSPELLKQAACFEKCFQKETLQSLDAWPAVFHNQQHAREADSTWHADGYMIRVKVCEGCITGCHLLTTYKGEFPC